MHLESLKQLDFLTGWHMNLFISWRQERGPILPLLFALCVQNLLKSLLFTDLEIHLSPARPTRSAIKSPVCLRESVGKVTQGYLSFSLSFLKKIPGHYGDYLTSNASHAWKVFWSFWKERPTLGFNGGYFLQRTWPIKLNPRSEGAGGWIGKEGSEKCWIWNFKKGGKISARDNPSHKSRVSWLQPSFKVDS